MPPEEIARIKWRFMDMASECTDGKFRVDGTNREIVSSLFDYFMGIPGKLDTGKGIWISENMSWRGFFLLPRIGMRLWISCRYG